MAGHDPKAAPTSVRLRDQPRDSAHQQRLRTGASSLRHVPKSHQLLSLRMGSLSIRQHSIRRRNRPPTRYRRPASDPNGNPQPAHHPKKSSAPDLSNYFYFSFSTVEEASLDHKNAVTGIDDVVSSNDPDGIS